MRSRSPTPVVLWGFWCGGCLLLLLDRGQGAESYKFRSSRQRAPPHYEGRYSAELVSCGIKPTTTKPFFCFPTSSLPSVFAPDAARFRV